MVCGVKLKHWVIISKEYVGPIAHLGWHWYGSLQPEMYVPCDIWIFGVVAVATTQQ